MAKDKAEAAKAPVARKARGTGESTRISFDLTSENYKRLILVQAMLEMNRNELFAYFLRFACEHDPHGLFDAFLPKWGWDVQE